MMDPTLLRRLKQIVGADRVAARRHEAEVYSYDASLAVGAPDAAVFPADTEQTAAVIRVAAEAGIPCVPRGFGTNLSGGSVAPQGGPGDRAVAAQPHPGHPAGRAIRGGPAGRDQPRAAKRACPARFLFRSRPGQPEGGHARRQRGRELGRTPLREIRSDHESRAGHDRGARRRPGGPHRRTGARSARLRSPRSARGERGDAGRHHRVGGPHLAVPGVGAHASGRLRRRGRRRAIGVGHHCGGDRSGDAGNDGRHGDPRRRGEQAVRLSLGRGRRADRRGRRPGRRAGRPGGADRPALHREPLPPGPPGERRRRAGPALGRSARRVRRDCPARPQLPRGRLHGAQNAPARGARAGCRHRQEAPARPRKRLSRRRRKPPSAAPVRLPQSRPGPAGSTRQDARSWRPASSLGGTISGEHGVGMEKSDAMRLVFSEDDLDLQRRLRVAFDPRGLLNPAKVLPPPLGNGEDAQPAGRLPPRTRSRPAIES